MTFSYPILTEEQIEAQRKILEEGIYPFTVKSALEGISKSGNNMVTLTLEIWNHEGKSFIVKDFLVAVESMCYKIRNFWKSVGKPERYETGNIFIDEFINQSGLVKTRLEKEMNGDRRFVRVADYMQPIDKIEENLNDSENFLSDDDLPFL
jgi:hypothetical protein